MALDDFATAAEMGLDQAEIDLDEDLFDFPMQSPQESRSEREGPSEGSASESPPPTPADEPVAKAEASAPSMVFDPELDEDLFGFPSSSPAGMEPAARSESALEQHIDQATQGVSNLLEDDLDELIGTEEPVLPSQTLTARPESAAAPPLARPAATPMTVPISGTISPRLMPEGNSRIAWTLTATVILFVVGLLVVSWRATASLDRSMVGMQESLEDGNRRMAAQNELTLRRLAEMEAELLRQQKIAAQAAAGVPAAEKPREMMAPHELSLLVAREALDEGRYGEARRLLYHLLATADRLGTKERAMAEQTAAFLIGRSYQAEAEALEEGA